jgi:hypothetical protein
MNESFRLVLRNMQVDLMRKISKYMLNRDPEKTKDMLTVGKLKAILQNWSDDSPVTVSVDNKSAPRDIKRTGTLITKRHKNPDIITGGVGLFLWRDDDYK